MSSLNSGLYSTGRVLRSLGMSKQAPPFTLKMSSSGVPWAGIVMTSVVFVFGAVLNALAPDAFEIALEAAAIGVVFTWATIFVCQLRLRKLVNLGVIPASKFQAPGYPWTSYIGLAFLVFVAGRDGHLGLAALAVLLAQDRLHRRRVRHPDHRGDPPSIGWLIVQAQGRGEHRRPDQGGLVGDRPHLRLRGDRPRERADRPVASPADRPRPARAPAAERGGLVTRSLRRLWPAAAAASLAMVLAACSSGDGPNPTPAAAPGATRRQADDRHLLRPAGPRAQERRHATPGSTSTPRRTWPRRWACRRRTSPGWRPTRANRENLLTDGEVDLVFSTYSITDERKQKVDFAGPYFVAHQDLLVRRNEEEITGPETLDGRILCSVAGTTSAAYVKEHTRARSSCGSTRSSPTASPPWPRARSTR